MNPVEGHYQGPTIQGVPNGNGKFIYLHGKEDTHKFSFVYVGNFLNGHLHGSGRKLDGQGYKLECDFVNGKAHGAKGRFYYPGGNLMYEGEYREGQKTGQGKKYYASGKLMFEGQLIDNKWTGFGKKYFEHNPNGTQ